MNDDRPLLSATEKPTKIMYFSVMYVDIAGR